jgi:hypothetical protein
MGQINNSNYKKKYYVLFVSIVILKIHYLLPFNFLDEICDFSEPENVQFDRRKERAALDRMGKSETFG